METLVGINQESTQSKRRVLRPRKKDGPNSNPRRRHIARGRVTRAYSVTTEHSRWSDSFKADCGRGKASGVYPAEPASGQRETSFASVAIRTWFGLDRARFAPD